MNSLANISQEGTEVMQLTSMIKMMANAIEKSSSTAEKAMNVAVQSQQDLQNFRESVQDVLERQNRISSNQIRIIRRQAEAKVRHVCDGNDSLKRKYFKQIYRSIHDACLVNTITDIPEKLYDHALQAVREWYPSEL